MDKVDLVEFSCYLSKSQLARFTKDLSHGKFDFLHLNLIHVIPESDGNFYISGYISLDFKLEDIIYGPSMESK